MRDVLYLAWRYLAYHKIKTTVLIAAVTITLYLPVGLEVLVSQSAEQLTARARSTPLIIGAKGSPLELVLSSLYFESSAPPVLKCSEMHRAQQSDLGLVIPISARFKTRHSPIVGTTLDYFQFRQLTLAQGRSFGMLGECVLGAEAAEKAGVQPGDKVLTSHEDVFSLTSYPLKMRVVGVLQATGTADDQAVFVDVKTAWVIEGLGHGHQDLRRPDQAKRILKKEGKNIVANASVVEHNEITPENLASFHFHGDVGTFPITAVIVSPKDTKSATLLRGRYVGENEVVQIVEPSEVMDELLQTIFTVQSYVTLAIILLGITTLATMGLVLTLSIQQRRREIETMSKIGGARIRILGVVVTEILGVLVLGAVLAAGLAVLTTWCAPAVTRVFIVQS